MDMQDLTPKPVDPMELPTYIQSEEYKSLKDQFPLTESDNESEALTS